MIAVHVAIVSPEQAVSSSKERLYWILLTAGARLYDAADREREQSAINFSQSNLIRLGCGSLGCGTATSLPFHRDGRSRSATIATLHC